MSSILGNALSGLLSFQSSLATTSHNIANVNTEGFSRQRVNLTTLPANQIGGASLGSGVGVNGIDRVLDGFQVAEVRTQVTQQGRLEVFSQLSRELDSFLGNSASGLSPALLGFFEGVQAAADDPSSTAARQSLLSQAGVLTERFASLDNLLVSKQNTLTDRVSASLPEVNSLAAALADLNTGITAASSGVSGAPNDLLDQRDHVIAQLAEQLSVEVVAQSDGALNIFIGSGQALVLGGQASSLRLGNGEFGGVNPEIFLDSIAGTSLITNSLSGGQIGGLLDAGRELIDPSRNQLGQLSVALAKVANEVHGSGLTLNGELGGDLFSIGQPKVFESANNAGTGTLELSISDASELTASDYQVQISGSDVQLIRMDTRTTVPLSGSGTALDPYVADGLEIVVSGSLADGDAFMLKPTSGLASEISLAVNNTADLALAGAVRASTDLANSGTVQVESVGVVDSTNSDLLGAVSIEFLSDSTFSVNGAGSFAYSADTPIEINGWQLALSGTPQPGDRVEVDINVGGVGDNRNALALSQVFDEGVLEGGRLSVEDAYSVLLSNVSTTTQQSEIRLEAQNTITQQAIAEQQSVSGVNLDEEAANMVRFQQAYQATAQMLSVADSLFQTLLGAVR